MPPKKKNANNGKGESSKDEVEFEPVVYVTNKVSTMIDMLDSPEPKLLLRVVGTLNKIATNSVYNVRFMLSRGLYPKLNELLALPEVYILRFTLSLIEKVVSNCVLIDDVDLSKLFKTASQVKGHYLQLQDDIVRSLCAKILLHLVKHNSMISGHVLSIEFVAKIFEILKTQTEMELVLNNIQLLFYILDFTKVDIDLSNPNQFDIAYLLCLFESNYESLRYWAVHILHKIAMWKESEILLILGREKVIESMTRLILADLYCDLCFEAIYACLSEIECAKIFVKTLEFVRFLEWVKTCPRILVGHASSILKSLSNNEDLVQVLFDFSAEESAVSLFRHINEAVILNVCDVILNMMRHKYCLESLGRPPLMRIFVEIMHDDGTFPMLPYGEKALRTLHRFFQTHIKTVKLVYESGSINMLKDIFETSKKKMNPDGYMRMVEIMQYLVKSEYAYTLMDIGMIQLIIDLYFESSFDEADILTVMESFLENDEFREIFVERDGLSIMLDKIRRRKDIECSNQTLLALKKLLTYKKVGQTFIDLGYLADLKYLRDNLKFDTPLIEEIIEMLYDFCLTLKFFYKHKLEEDDKIRDQFMLIPDEITMMALNNFNVKAAKISDRIPIYVVRLNDLLSADKDQKAKSIMEVRSGDRSLFAGSRKIPKMEDEVNPFYRLTMTTKNEDDSSEDTATINRQSSWRNEDSSLAKMIVEIYNEIRELHPPVYEKLHSRVKMIAMRVDYFLSKTENVRKQGNAKQAFEYRIRKLMDKSNFVPIGKLKLGYQCEKALMFKVICDQTNVPTTLCKEDGSYFNEITLFGNNMDLHKMPLVQRKFIVDLMEKVGDLIPIESAAAKSYLQRHRTVF